MICPGLVTNVTNFGAFVDIGVHQDGLVHISELAHRFVDDPRKVVNPGDQVTVKVLKVDQAKNQISLTMKLEAAPEAPAPSRERRPPMQNNSDRRQDGPRRPDGHQQRPAQHKDSGKPSNRGPSSGGQAPRPNQGGGFAGKNSTPFNNPFAALLNQGQNKK